MQGTWRTAFLIFFISHIPITVLIDGQAVFSPFYPRILQRLVAWYADAFGDGLMGKAPSLELTWFSSIVCAELLFQLPFFFVAVRMLLSYPDGKGGTTTTPNGRSTGSGTYPNWFRTACLIYGSHVSTTLVPITVSIALSSETSTIQKCMTLASTCRTWSSSISNASLVFSFPSLHHQLTLGFLLQ